MWDAEQKGLYYLPQHEWVVFIVYTMNMEWILVN